MKNTSASEDTLIVQIATKTVSLALCLTFLVSCGGGGESTNEAPLAGAEPLDVTGMYTFLADTAYMECPLGLRGLVVFPIVNILVTQTSGAIAIEPAGDLPDGDTSLIAEPMTGTVDENGNFTASSSGAIEYDNILIGDADFTVRAEGRFTESGWSGEFTQTLSFSNVGIGCELATTARGDKIG